MPNPLNHPKRQTRQRVRELAKRHPLASVTQIAKALGVTPQRVSQIASEDEIPIGKGSISVPQLAVGKS